MKFCKNFLFVKTYAKHFHFLKDETCSIAQVMLLFLKGLKKKLIEKEKKMVFFMPRYQ